MKMRRALIYFTILTLAACDSSRLYESNQDFETTQWVVERKPAFEFRITDLGKSYNLYCNVRNTSEYPYARLFVNYLMRDSTGAVINKELTSLFLFDATTGKPFGNSGIGDVFDHQHPILSEYRFPYLGRFTVEFEQQMRLDTLAGISAVGLRVEVAPEAGASDEK